MRSMAQALEVKVPGWEKPMDERFLGDQTTVIILAVVYLISLQILKSNAYGVKSLAPAVKLVSTVNNWVMCVYSIYSFVGMSLVLAANWADDGFPIFKAVCDPEKRMLRGMDFWLYHFYLSKFWEWIDTWILVLKGKPVWPPSNSQFLLHVVHHCVTASIFWLSWREELSMGYLGPLTNSFVHIPMYGYYCLSEHWQGVRNFGVYITPTQIIQFLIVMAGLVPNTISPAECGSTPRAVAWWWITYTFFLCFFTKMFMDKMNARSARIKAEKGL